MLCAKVLQHEWVTLYRWICLAYIVHLTLSFFAEVGLACKTMPVHSIRKAAITHLVWHYILRLSQLHQSDQGMLPNMFSWKFIEELF